MLAKWLWVSEWLSRAVLAGSGVALFAVALMVVEQRWIYLDEASIVISGGGDEVQTHARAILMEHAGSSLLAVDLHEQKQRLENLPGVARAHLQRRLPHTLHVRLEKHQPLARWMSGGLIDIYGVRYDGSGDLSLPVFDGPPGSVQNMIALFESAQTILADYGRIKQLELSARGEWRVFLDDGIILYLGRDRPRSRMRLYARHATQLRNQFATLRGIDLRYEHGFTVINHTEGDNQG